MSPVLLTTLCFFFFLLLKLTTPKKDGFVFNGFNSANLSVDGVASITSDGLLVLTNTTEHTKGHAFYSLPLHFKSSSGLLNANNNGNATNHIIAVELDTIQNAEFQDIDDNHLGIDINSMKSNKSHTAGFYEDITGSFKNLTLISGQPMQVWIEFDGKKMQLNVTLSQIGRPKPAKPLLSSTVDLNSLMLDTMYIGFSSSVGSFRTYHYILGWSFKVNGVAAALDYLKLPPLPRIKPKHKSNILAIWLPVGSCSLVILIMAATVFIMNRRIKYAEIREDWELEYGPHRFSYKDLFLATKGFKETELLGSGGFGRVYRGVLPTSKMEVAVKKVSHESRQGMKEFVAEIVSIGQVRHRNPVQLLGYCRRKGELLLVYDFMPNSSLDKFLYDQTRPTINWAQRFHIIKGVASGLLYLHEDWEQVVIHRDVKASNVLLDSEFNGRLGDFGLARLYDHGTDPQTTHIVGTMGYLAPELARNGKASTVTDVFAFGAILLEVACARRPVNPNACSQELVLMDWVVAMWQRGLLLETRDPRLGVAYNAYEVELVLKLGLLCSHPLPEARPSMHQVMQFLEGEVALPQELSPNYLSSSLLSKFPNEECIKSFPSSSVSSLSGISGGR